MTDTCPVCGKGEWEKDTVSHVPHLDCVLRLNATLKLRDEALFHAEADASREHDCVEHWSLRAEQAEAERDELQKMLRLAFDDYVDSTQYDKWLAEFRRLVRDVQE